MCQKSAVTGTISIGAPCGGEIAQQKQEICVRAQPPRECVTVPAEKDGELFRVPGTPGKYIILKVGGYVVAKCFVHLCKPFRITAQAAQRVIVPQECAKQILHTRLQLFRRCDGRQRIAGKIIRVEIGQDGVNRIRARICAQSKANMKLQYAGEQAGMARLKHHTQAKAGKDNASRDAGQQAVIALMCGTAEAAEHRFLLMKCKVGYLLLECSLQLAEQPLGL